MCLSQWAKVIDKVIIFFKTDKIVFLRYFLDGKFDAMSALQSILRQSQNHGPSHAVRPNEVVFNMRKIGGHFCHGRQECAHEFTRLFMDAMLRSSSQGHVSF